MTQRYCVTGRMDCLHRPECGHNCYYDTAQPEQPEQDACGWQFYAGGKWHTGMEVNDHRVNTEAAGIPTRNVYPGPVAQPEQGPVASIYITPGGEREVDDWRHTLPVGRNLLYTAPPQPLTNEEITNAFNEAMAKRPKDASNAETNRLFARAIETAHGIGDKP